MSLSTFNVEISSGASWVSLNSGAYKVAGETRSEVQTQWRKITSSSPVMEGTYLVHAVKDEITETVHVYVHGATHADVTTNLATLEALFSQPSYQIRFTYENSRETWTCQTADYSIQRGQVFAHNTMAVLLASVPRRPTTTTEVI